MIHNHEHYEMLTVLATAGQLSESELSDLEQHTRECVPCLHAMAEMEEVGRQLFLAQSGNTSRLPSPAGMQQRFQERARSAGIPLSVPVAPLFWSGFLHPALATLLLTVLATLSWKLLVAPPVEQRAFVEADNSAQTLVTLHPGHELSMTTHHPLSTFPQKRHAIRRKALAEREPVAVSSSQIGSLSSRPSFTLFRPSFLQHDDARPFSGNTSLIPGMVNGDYMTAGLHLPAQIGFDSAPVPSNWAAAVGERSSQRTFHYNPDFASLSSLDGAQAGGITYMSPENMSRSMFHLSKTW